MELKLKCTSLDYNGSGIVEYEKKKYKVALLENEEGLFDFTNNRLTLQKVLVPSNKRIKSKCPVFNLCGGCQYMEIEYSDELELKKKYLTDLFCKMYKGEISINGMFNPYNYRNKCQMVYKLSKTKKPVCGFYQEKSHSIIPVSNCYLHAEAATKLIEAFNMVLAKNKIKPYDERTGEGVIRHVLVRYGFFTKQIMLVIVTNGEMFPGRNNVIKDLLKLNIDITTIVQNYNARDTSIVLGDKERVLFGPGFIYDNIGKYRFKISARSFYQVNAMGMKKLYDKAIELADIKGTDIVLDTYCGVGTISIFASSHAKHVYGVELNPDAVKDAIVNARLNQIGNIDFIKDDATKYMQKLATIREHVDIVIMDPPRTGSTKQFIGAIGHLKPKKVIYVSCDPETMKRDLFDFFEVGYVIKKMDFFDMFPRTFNVETIVLLSHRNPDTTIDVELSHDDLPLTKSEMKATYKDIENYVMEKYGVKITSLEVAQIKEKYGIKERANYNKPTSNSKYLQPKCGKEKEEYITEALKFFKMIK